MLSSNSFTLDATLPGRGDADLPSGSDGGRGGIADGESFDGIAAILGIRSSVVPEVDFSGDSLSSCSEKEGPLRPFPALFRLFRAFSLLFGPLTNSVSFPRAGFFWHLSGLFVRFSATSATCFSGVLLPLFLADVETCWPFPALSLLSVAFIDAELSGAGGFGSGRSPKPLSLNGASSGVSVFVHGFPGADIVLSLFKKCLCGQTSVHISGE